MTDTVTTQIGPWAMVPVWVLKVGLSGADLAVYVSLRSYADRAGEAHPRVKTIAERAGVSERTAERGISRLRELGLIETTKRYRDDGSVAGCNYFICDLPPANMSPGPDEDVARGTDEDVATLPTGMSEQEHTTEHTSKNISGSSDLGGSRRGPRASAQPRERRPRRDPHDHDQLNADYTALRGLCLQEGLDEDPVHVWWTLRKDHKADWPSLFMARLIEDGRLDGFLGRHGVNPYDNAGNPLGDDPWKETA